MLTIRTDNTYETYMDLVVDYRPYSHYNTFISLKHVNRNNDNQTISMTAKLTRNQLLDLREELNRIQF